MTYQQPYDQHYVTREQAPPPYAPSATTVPPATNFGDPAKPHGGGAGGGSSAAERGLSASPPWNDKWWALAFIAQLIGLVVVGGICYNKWRDTFAPGSEPGDNENHSSDLGPLEHALPLIAVAIAVGLLQAAGWLWLMQRHGRTLIWITLIFGLIVSGAAIILAAMAGSVVGVVLAAIFFALNAWYVYSVRHKIPFAAAMLHVSLRSMSMFKSSFLIPIWGMILMSGLAFVWSICAMSIIYAIDNGSADGPRSARGFIFFLLALSLFWTILTIKGWVHTSIAGVQATWYFLVPQAVPSNPVWHSIKRASTTSFGSICFGSFIVAFIRTVRFFVNMAYQNARQSRNQWAACALCVLECLIGLLESIVNYVNQYAFAICAIYGKAFMPAAQEAWGLMRSRGFDAVINDSLIGGVLAFAQIISGLLTGIVTALIANYSFDTDWRPYAGVGFVIGVMLLTVVAEVVEAAVITTFICLADDPATLQRTKPVEYTMLVDPLHQNYPDIRGGGGAHYGGHV